MIGTLYKDLSGCRFGRLIVVRRCGGGGDSKPAIWECKCDCGSVCYAATDNLKSGDTQSCGCLRKEWLTDGQKKHGDSKRGRFHRLYKIWADMKNRCLNENSHRYKDYGGRGISVCSEWMAYEPFKEWALNNGYEDNLTIDRIDCNGNYEPSNCRWATYLEQNANTRRSKRFAYNGETHTIREWSEITGLSMRLLSQRLLARQWDIERALTTPNMRTKIST